MDSWGFKEHANVSAGISIFEVLSGLSFKTLDESRRNFNIRREDFTSKNELEYLLGCRIIEKIKGNLQNLDYERYSILKSFSVDKNLECDQQSLYSFSIMNMAIKNTHDKELSFMMPDELFDAFLEVDSPALLDRVKKNSELYELINGCILSYGLIDSNHLQKIVSKHTSFKLSDERFKEAVVGCETIYGTIIADDVLVYSRCFNNPDYYIKEQAKVKEFDYKEFSKEELIQAADVMFVPDNPCYWRLMQLLRRFFRCSEEMSRVCTAVLINYAKVCRTIEEAVEYILNELGVPRIEFIEEFFPLYCEYNNCTGKWALKGHTPNEITKIKNPEIYEMAQRMRDKESGPGRVVPFMAN